VRPRVSRLLQDDTHRLIAAAFTDANESVLNRLTSDPEKLSVLFELEGATNGRLQGEAGLLPGISVRELVFGLSYCHIVNAAFTHAHPLGSRFNGPDRGAWYAALSLETSSQEVAFHKSRELQEINWRNKETFVFVDFLADFRGEFHDIREDSRFRKCLAPDSYAASQQLAGELVHGGSAGIVYPSVRHQGGTCIACFRPALVNNVRKGSRVSITFLNAFAPPHIRVRR
jgi:RES domain-containing protein